MSRRPDRAGRARSLSRKLAMQALYQWQLTGQTAAELRNQYAGEEGFGDADADYFRELIGGITDGAPTLDAELGSLIDRPVAQLDPVERAVLLIGLYELAHHLDVPYRVVITRTPPRASLASMFAGSRANLTTVKLTPDRRDAPRAAQAFA